MQKQLFTANRLKIKYPQVKKFVSSQMNEDICKYAATYVEETDILLTALLINPLGKTEKVEEIKKNFGGQVLSNLLLINRLHNHDEKLLKLTQKYKKIIIVYLASFKIIFDNFSKKEIRRLFPVKALRYAMKILEKNDITQIRLALEDNFFSLLQPEVYKNYSSLLKFTRKKFAMKQKEISRNFQKMIKENNIQAQIEGRVKTIFSIHNKITKKNILFSQILDTIGIRILVDTDEACYRSMVCILRNYPIMTSRVKDYIAVPKSNGYQSIHLTILYENHPIEIQIRTYDMHVQAQYGRASHVSYKNNA